MVQFFKLLLLANLVSGDFVRKEIPHHIMKTIGDPKIKHVAKHDIPLDLILSGGLIKKDPYRRKSHDEIARVPDHEMHVEDISEDTLYINPHHITNAEEEHQIDLRARLRKAFKDPDADQMAEKAGST
jgi:hypothetical protein